MLKRLLGTALLGLLVLSAESASCMRRGTRHGGENDLATELATVRGRMACSALSEKTAITAFVNSVLQGVNTRLAASVVGTGVRHTDMTTEDIFLDLQAKGALCTAKWAGEKWQFTFTRELFTYYLGEAEVACFDWSGIKKRVENIDWIVDEMIEAIQQAARRAKRT